jgi:hypothetical protein
LGGGAKLSFGSGSEFAQAGAVSPRVAARAMPKIAADRLFFNLRTINLLFFVVGCG